METPKPKPRPKTRPRANTAPPKPRAPTPPKITFKYLGLLGPKNDKIAVFETGSEEEDPVLIRVGEVIEKKFRLLGFQYEAVLIGYVDERFKDQNTELEMEK